MSRPPSGKSAKVAFFRAHVAPWNTNAVAIGTTVAAVTDLTTKVTAAEAAIAAQIAAEQAAVTATMAADNAVRTVTTTGAAIVKAIRAKAAVSGDSVYELAELPAPAVPQPVTTLGTPADFKAELNGDGSLTLKWKCASPRASGVTYRVARALDGSTDFAYVGGSGSKQFVDATVPAGTSMIVYQVQAIRSTAAGAAATFTVLLGAGAGGQMTATVAPAAPMKAAA